MISRSTSTSETNQDGPLEEIKAMFLEMGLDADTRLNFANLSQHLEPFAKGQEADLQVGFDSRPIYAQLARNW